MIGGPGAAVNSAMKLGFPTKLFLALIATSILAALATGVAARVSFTHGFVGYLNEQGIERIESLIPGFVAAYEERGSWRFLNRNGRAWFHLISPRPEGGRRDQPPPLPETALVGVEARIGLLDAEKRYAAGNPLIATEEATMRSIVVKGRTVGYLGIIPFQRATAAADVRFQERQLRAIWVIAVVSILAAGIISILLSRWLLAPVKRIASATHRLAAGDYSGRLQVATRDDIGQLAEDFNQLARTLEKNEQMRRAFMADVSHELRTPLAVLRGELEAIEDGVRKLTPETLRSLQAEVTTLSKIVSDLYDLSLSDVGALTYRKTDVDVGEVLQLTLGAFRERLAERNITVDAQIPEPGPVMSADEGRLLQLFNNILENSVRYTHAGGKLRVTCESTQREIHIDFQDSEPGVPLPDLPRLFERFFRTESSRNRASGGAGLGLAICKNIVEAHGGHIEAKASPLGGVWISMSFPK